MESAFSGNMAPGEGWHYRRVAAGARVAYCF